MEQGFIIKKLTDVRDIKVRYKNNVVLEISNFPDRFLI